MKAEHRKELQTNLLADRMGRLIQNVKTRPSRRAVLYVILVLAVVVAGVIIWMIRSGDDTRQRDQWMAVEQATSDEKLLEVAKEFPKTQQGKSARMMLNWINLWEGGIKPALSDPKRAEARIKDCRAKYVELADDCKEDPILGSEAMYGVAICEEALACFAKPADLGGQLDTAREKFKEVVDKFPKTGFGDLADKRFNELEPKSASRDRITRFYQSAQLDAFMHGQNRFDIPFHKPK
jgi:hypothetical protein